MSTDPALISARRAVRALTRRAGENFTVLSHLVPRSLRDDYAAVYAFCRIADDAADDHPPAVARELLRQLRSHLPPRSTPAPLLPPATFTPLESPSVPSLALAPESLFPALLHTISTRRLPVQPFHDLLDAFEQDQVVTRYDTYSQLLDYCTRSANPVGRIVLALHGVARSDDPASRAMLAASDATCTALQLTNFWQDIRRDLLDRDRVYLPADTGISAADLRSWLPRANDPSVRRRLTSELRELCRRTHILFLGGRDLERLVEPRLAWILWLFRAGGMRTLRLVEADGYVTLWDRPRLSRPARASLLLRATWGSFRGVRPGPASEP